MTADELFISTMLVSVATAIFLLCIVYIEWKGSRKQMTPLQLAILGLVAVIGISILISVGVLVAGAVRYRQAVKTEKSLLTRLQAAAEQTTGQTPRKHPINWSQ